MKISTEIFSAKRIVGEERAIELIAKAGFDAWDYSIFEMCEYDENKKMFVPCDFHPFGGNEYLKFSRRLKRIADDNGIICNQAHAPSPASVYYIKRAIECAAEVGAEFLVVHPEYDVTPEENAQMYLELLEFAKPYGVKLATENMYNWNAEKEEAYFAACGTPESFNAHLDAVNDENLVACLDIGHAEMYGDVTSAVAHIKALGSRLKLLHIHDNDRRHDSHQLPFTMNIDFEKIAKALKEINYSGYFTMEADNHLKAYDESNIMEGLNILAATARRFVDMFNEAN